MIAPKRNDYSFYDRARPLSSRRRARPEPAMPKISDTHRAMRRGQILEAAWRCFHRKGVQATTIEEIIGESGLSASAMYRYFAGKDDIILAAITVSLSQLSQLLEPIVADESLPGPAELVQAVCGAIDRFARRDGFDLGSIALHGWSEAQHNGAIRELIRSFYAAFRKRLQARAARWTGTPPRSRDNADVARTLMSLILGFVAQRALMGDAAPAAHANGLAQLGERSRRT